MPQCTPTQHNNNKEIDMIYTYIHSNAHIHINTHILLYVSYVKITLK
jgi:hypothetical protein